MKVRDAVLYLDGEKVWLYSPDDLKPSTQVKSITILIDGNKIEIPKPLLVGLYDVPCKSGFHPAKESELLGALWLEPDGKTWHVFFGCGDGGVAYDVYLHGRLNTKRIYRVDYRQSIVVGKFSSTLAHDNGELDRPEGGPV